MELQLQWRVIENLLGQVQGLKRQNAVLSAVGAEKSPAITPEQKAIVEETWAKAAALGAETVGVLLFKQIFEIAPEALMLFSFKDEPDLYESEKLKNHGIKVVTTVGSAVSLLDDLEKLVPILTGLGKKHVNYGVHPAHYAVVGQALLQTLAAGLGENSFTPQAKEAWVAVWGVVSNTMMGDNY
jgi:hemoglobin-like flavoprotein